MSCVPVAQSTCSFQLLCTSLLEDPGRTDVALQEPDTVPAGLSYLCVTDGRRPSMQSEPTADATHLLEPLHLEDLPILLVVSLIGTPVVVNGGWDTCLGTVRGGDTIDFRGCPWTLRVRLTRAAVVGSPPPAYLGRTCQLCRGPIDPNDVIYICPVCKSLLHAAPEHAAPEATAAGCLDACVNCPFCNTPTETTTCS